MFRRLTLFLLTNLAIMTVLSLVLLLVTQIPTVLHAELYAVAALAGAAVVAGHVLHLPPTPVTVGGALLCFGLRLLAISRGWRLPIAQLPQ